MCQYSSDNGHATDWHFVHIGGFATRGVGAICMEATSVVPEGRISPEDAVRISFPIFHFQTYSLPVFVGTQGLWTDTQIAPLKRIVNFCHAQGTRIGVQLTHSGRKSSTLAPWVHLNAAKTQRSTKWTAEADENGWPDNGAYQRCDYLRGMRAHQHSHICSVWPLCDRVRGRLPESEGAQQGRARLC